MPPLSQPRVATGGWVGAGSPQRPGRDRWPRTAARVASSSTPATTAVTSTAVVPSPAAVTEMPSIAQAPASA